MKISIRKGIGFGLTSGIITTLGLIVGLNSGTHSKLIVLTGIFTIAIADAFSDAFGVHISEESGRKNITKKEIWESSITTFLSKLFFALTFLIPVLLLNLKTSIIVSIIWGLFLITLFSYYISKKHKTSTLKAIFEHLLITLLVIFITNFVGIFISNLFS